jgi:hypothetical protein
VRDTLLSTAIWKRLKLRMAQSYLAELRGDAIAKKKELLTSATTTHQEGIGIKSGKKEKGFLLLDPGTIRSAGKNELPEQLKN